MAHDHAHHHHSHAAAPPPGSRKVFLIGISLNLLFVLAEVVAGLVYNSMALLTDAGHNASDVAGLLLSLTAFWMAQKKSSAVYTYGYKKTTVLAALANSVILLIAIGILGYESVLRLLRPQPVAGGVVAWVAGLGIVVNSVSAFLFYRRKSTELNTKGAYLHLLSDALVSLGVVATGLVMRYTGWYWLDPATGLVIMVVILTGTWSLLRDSFRMTIDAVPSGIELEKVKTVIRTVPHVQAVSHVHVWPLSTTENALTAHVVLEETLSFDEKLSTIAAIKHALEHHQIQHSTIELAHTAA